MIRLYDIPFALRNAFDSMEVDPETGEIFGAENLDAIEGEAAAKIENAGLYLKELNAEAAALKVEADRLTERRRSLERKSDRIKSLMLPALDALGGKVKGNLLTVSVGTTKSVELDENALDVLPEDFIRTKREADKVTIGKLLKAGETIPGAHLVETKGIRMR